MLKQEQIRPFLLGALISAGGIIVVNYTASNEGYFQCMRDVAHIKYMEHVKEEKAKQQDVLVQPKVEEQADSNEK